MANTRETPIFSDEAFPLQAVTGTIIAGAFAVFKRFGHGFLESVYQRALGVDLRRRGVRVEQEVKYELFHLGEPVGCYKADMVVDSRVIVETKTGLLLDPLAPVQLLNYYVPPS
jgi:GxxExxY protein